MVRIIPWNLPPVNGGSVGGYTPAPTPVVTSYPYDLDNIQVSADFGFNKVYAGSAYRTLVVGKVAISGVVINDSTSVGSVIAHVHVTPGTDTWSGEHVHYSLNEADVDVEVGSIMSSVGGEVDASNSTSGGMPYLDDFMAYNYDTYPTLVSTTSTITVTGITVYNSNGVAIQEWSP